MKKFEVYEDNGGMLWLFILDDDGKAIAGFGNFEQWDGSLADAIADLQRDPDSYESWGGDLGHDIEIPHGWKFDEDGETVDTGEKTIDEVYHDNADSEYTTLIAWCDDGENVEYCETRCMGFAARASLNIPDEDDDDDE